MANRFIPDDYDHNLENKLFDEKWYIKVSSAINYTFDILENNNKRILLNKETIAKAIIDYNIEKKLSENVDSLPIPTLLDWSKANSVQIFDEFASIVCLCNKNDKFKRHVVKIICNNNKSAIEQFKFWEKVNNEEKNNTIISDKIQKNNIIICIIKRRT